jgi:predicted  nucleic acid-binding Zn-ribbon protein
MEDKIFPLEPLKSKQVKEAAAAEKAVPVEEAVAAEEDLIAIEEPPAGPQPPPQQASKFAQRRSKVDTSKGARMLTYMVLVEFIVILVIGGFNIYMRFFQIPALNKEIGNRGDKIKEANSRIEQLNIMTGNLSAEKSKLTSELNDTKDISEGQAQQIKILEEEKTFLSQAKQEAEQKLTQIMDEKVHLEAEFAEIQTTHKNLERNYKEVVDSKAEMEKSLERVQKEKDKIKKEYDTLKEGIDLQTKAAYAKKEEIEKEYEKYAPASLKVVEELNKIALSLKEGITIKTYNSLVKGLEFPYEAFKMVLNENSYNYLSFKLISSSYDNYKEVLERLKTIVNISRVLKEGIKWSEIILKLENPIVTQRPRLDSVQELWHEAVAFTQVGGFLVENKEEFSEKCIFCEGREKITCLKCAGSGNCIKCDGQGHIKERLCIFCQGLGKCPICSGRTFVPCKVCQLYADVCKKAMSKSRQGRTEEPSPKASETPPEPPPETKPEPSE